MIFIMEYDDFVKFSSFKNYDFWFDPLHYWITKLDCKSYCSILIMFVTAIVRCGSFILVSILSIQILVEHIGFDFESIELSFFLHLDMAFGSWK